MYVDGSSNKSGNGAMIVLEGPRRVRIEQSLTFGFKASNNQVEYKALVVGLLLARDMEVHRIKCRSDSQLTVNQIRGEYQVKDPLLLRYFHKVSTFIAEFKNVEIQHVWREENTRENTLSKMASGRSKRGLDTVIQQILPGPTVTTNECMSI